MKKFMITTLAVMMIASTALAFMYQINILSVEQIKALDDKALQAAYVDAKIEEKVSGEFHEAAGFSSGKDYDKRKALISYIINLRREMAARELTPEPLDEWLK